MPQRIYDQTQIPSYGTVLEINQTQIQQRRKNIIYTKFTYNSYSAMHFLTHLDGFGIPKDGKVA